MTGHQVANAVPTEIYPANANVYRPSGSAREVFFGREPVIVMDGPAGTGKSRALLEKLNALCLKYSGMRALVVRKTRASLTQTTLVTWEDHVKPGCETSNQQRSQRQSYKYANGSEVVVGGMDKPIKIMSSEYDVILAFEAVEFSEDDFESFTTRLRNGVMPYQQLLADCNPGPPTHWLHQRMLRGQARRIICRHQDNPRLYQRGELTPYGAAYMRVLDDLTGVRRDRLRDGKWVAAEGMVYSEWDDAVHLLGAFPIPANWRRVRVVDFGYTNPFVCQWWAMDPDNRAYLYREIYCTQRLVEDHAQDITRLSEGETIEATIADHDAEDRATLARYGIPTVAAHKSLSDGIQAVQSRLRRAGDGRPRLFILRDARVQLDQGLINSKKPTCTYEEIGGYVYPTAGRGRTEKEVPIKEGDHGLDAARYLIAWLDNLGRRNNSDAIAALDEYSELGWQQGG